MERFSNVEQIKFNCILNTMEIIHTQYGLANSFPTHIEINSSLINYPRLYEKVLQHEEKHHHKKQNAFVLDFTDAFSFFGLKMFWFTLTHPKTWRDFSPIIKDVYGNRHYDPVLLSFYILTIGGGILWLKMV